MRAPRLMGAERISVRKAMREAYEIEGLTIPQVAARFGRSYGTTHKLLTEAATHIRPPSKRPQGVAGRAH